MAATLLDDAAARAAIADADLVLVGADMLMSRGLVNKVGTYPMALAAQHGTPLYAVCGSEKFLPPGFRPVERRACAGCDRRRSALAPECQQPAVRLHADRAANRDYHRAGYPAGQYQAWLAATRLHPRWRTTRPERCSSNSAVLLCTDFPRAMRKHCI